MTSRPFIYEVSKNILQYLSLEKRIELAISCPDVRTAERSGDLYLDHLHLDDKFFTINDVTYRCNIPNHSMLIEREPVGMIAWKHVDMRFEDVWKKLFDFWLGGREVVKVKVLEVTNGYRGVSFPKNLKMECKELRFSPNGWILFDNPEKHHLKTLQFVRQFLTDTPLDKISMFVHNSLGPIFQENLFQTANCLEITKFSQRENLIVSELVQLTNPKIYVKSDDSSFAKEDFVTLAKSWVERCPKIGTRFTLHLRTAHPEYVREVLRLISPITEMRSGDELHILENYPRLVMEVR